MIARTVLVIALVALAQTHSIRVPIKILPIRPIRHPVTLPPIVGPNNTFTHPSAFATDCINALDQKIVDVCQSKANSDFDPSKLNTSTTTTWESCCSLFEELTCYIENANAFCPPSTENALKSYSIKLGNYFEHAICPSIAFNNTKASCNKAIHKYRVKHNHDHPSPNPGSFVNLPKDDGPEKACFKKLRFASSVNYETQCTNATQSKWDPNFLKFQDSELKESCCAIDGSLKCLDYWSKKMCTASEQVDMVKYTKTSLVAFQQSICKTINYNVCGGPKGSSSAIAPSFVFTLLTAALFIIRFHF